MVKKGKKHSEETRRKISKTMRDRTFSEEHRRKLSEALKDRKAWNKGKTGVISEETRRKMSEAQKARRNHYSEDRYTELSRVLYRENELVL